MKNQPPKMLTCPGIRRSCWLGAQLSMYVRRLISRVVRVEEEKNSYRRSTTQYRLCAKCHIKDPKQRFRYEICNWIMARAFWELSGSPKRVVLSVQQCWWKIIELIINEMPKIALILDHLFHILGCFLVYTHTDGRTGCPAARLTA